MDNSKEDTDPERAQCKKRRILFNCIKNIQQYIFFLLNISFATFLYSLFFLLIEIKYLLKQSQWKDNVYYHAYS